MVTQHTRRGLITGLGACFLAAPAIVRASSLMPISTRLIAPTIKYPSPIWTATYVVQFNGEWEILPEGLDDLATRITAANCAMLRG